MNPTKNTDSTQRIFISHSSHDKDTAHKILQFLESQGKQCWIAPRDIPPGAGWTESIMEGLSYSSVIVLIVSKSVNDSPHVRREIEYAVSSKIPIIPILIEVFSISKWLEYCISPHQWMKFSKGDWDDNLQLLWSALSREKLSLPPTLKVDRRTGKFHSLKKFDIFSKEKSAIQRKNTNKRRLLFIKSGIIGFVIGSGLWILHISYLSYRVSDELESTREKIIDLAPHVAPYIIGFGITYMILSLLVVKIWTSQYMIKNILILGTVISYMIFTVSHIYFLDTQDFYSFSYFADILFFLFPVTVSIGVIAAFIKYILIKATGGEIT